MVVVAVVVYAVVDGGVLDPVAWHGGEQNRGTCESSDANFLSSKEQVKDQKQGNLAEFKTLQGLE